MTFLSSNNTTLKMKGYQLRFQIKCNNKGRMRKYTKKIEIRNRQEYRSIHEHIATNILSINL